MANSVISLYGSDQEADLSKDDNETLVINQMDTDEESAGGEDDDDIDSDEDVELEDEDDVDEDLDGRDDVSEHGSRSKFLNRELMD